MRFGTPICQQCRRLPAIYDVRFERTRRSAQGRVAHGFVCAACRPAHEERLEKYGFEFGTDFGDWPLGILAREMQSRYPGHPFLRHQRDARDGRRDNRECICCSLHWTERYMTPDITTTKPFFVVCAWCKSRYRICTRSLGMSSWRNAPPRLIEAIERSRLRVSHGMCPGCFAREMGRLEVMETELTPVVTPK